jgi:NTE family protein
MNTPSKVTNRARAVAAAFAMLATYCPGLAAQTTPVAAPATAPRIGLALSGGGARGIAHVGVLKVLEELRVPIHCVTGTSMGAIVGGTFAAGTPPAEMEKIVLAADWDGIFRDKPPRRGFSVISHSMLAMLFELFIAPLIIGARPAYVNWPLERVTR